MTCRAWIVVTVSLIVAVSGAGEPPQGTPPLAPKPIAARNRLRAALCERRSFDWNDATLSEVVKDLSKILQADVVLDLRALEVAGLDGEVPVTFAAKDMSIQRAIELLLDSIVLTAAAPGNFFAAVAI